MKHHYWINEIFYSYQGEGYRAGTLNAFVRFRGCNMACVKEAGPKSPGGFDCDTEFESGTKMEAGDIIDTCERMMDAYFARVGEEVKHPNVIFTGGEPGLQLDEYLVAEFKGRGWYTAIETNGSIDVSGLGLDWISVSPKVAEHAIRQMTADEVRYVRGFMQAIPKPRCEAKHKLISPAFDGNTLQEEVMAWCEQLVRENPEWAISLQKHKIMGVR